MSKVIRNKSSTDFVVKSLFLEGEAGTLRVQTGSQHINSIFPFEVSHIFL